MTQMQQTKDQNNQPAEVVDVPTEAKPDTKAEIPAEGVQPAEAAADAADASGTDIHDSVSAEAPVSESFVSAAERPDEGAQAPMPSVETVSPDDFQKTAQVILTQAVNRTVFQACLGAVRTGQSGDNSQAVLECLDAFRQTGDSRYLVEAETLMPDDIQRIIERMREGEWHRNVAVLSDIQKKQAEAFAGHQLMCFQKQHEAWMKQEPHKNAVQMALTLGRGQVDLNQVKAVVDAVEKSAVQAYINRQASAENQALQHQLSGVDIGGDSQPDVAPHWLTRDEFYALSPSEYAKNYDKIVRQINLEKKGKLPKRLT